MAASVTQPIEPAIRRTRLILFKPFDLGKWFTLGFCAWLASLGQGGANFNFNPSSLRGGGGGQMLDPVIQWMKDNLLLVVSIAVAAALVILAISLVVMWLRSRGSFMLLDGVVNNRGDVAFPWKAFRRLGNSLFRMRIVLALIGLAGISVIGGIAALIAWPDIAAR